MLYFSCQNLKQKEGAKFGLENSLTGESEKVLSAIEYRSR